MDPELRPGSRHTACTFGLVVLVGCATSAAQFAELAPARRVSVAARTFVPADVDGDGAPDLLAAAYTEFGGTLLLRNDGGGAFEDVSATSLPRATAQSARVVAVGDIDADGDIDLALARYGNPILLNDGRGRFVESGASGISLSQPYDLALVDLDGDGDLDLLVADSSPPRALLFLNDGGGRFVDRSAQLPSPLSDNVLAVTPADIDGDGDVDVLVVGFRFPMVWVNDGSARFREDAGRLPPVTPAGSLRTADVDGDGAPDLLIVQARVILLLFNDGTGRFVDDPTRQSPPTPDDNLDCAFVDVDADGDQDLLLAKDSQTQQLRLLVNDGRGRYVDRTLDLVTPVRAAGFGLTVGDLDRDGAPDVLVGSVEEPVRYYGNVGGRLHNDDPPPRISPAWILRTNVSGLALGDLDGDGDDDLVVGGRQSMLYGDGRHRVLRNDGHGHFTLATSTTWGQWTTRVRLADIDRDGDLDILEANGRVLAGHGVPYIGGNEMVHFNDGRAGFVAVPLPAEDWSNSITPVDIDGDGDDDLAVANPGQNRLYLNSGGQSFADVTAWLPVDDDSTSDIAAVDVDGDGDLDLLVANAGQDRLYLNDGRGRFRDGTATHLPIDAVPTATIVAADVDGDGDADLLVATAGQPRLYRNDGAGVFADATSRLPVLPHAFANLAVIDVDADGDADVIAATSAPTGNVQVLLLNDGGGLFTRAPAARFPSNDQSAFFALGDLDSDQDQDVLLLAPYAGCALLNLERQLHSPAVFRPGRPYPLSISGRAGYASGPQKAIVFVGFGLAAQPLRLPPWGSFFVDPSVVVALPPLVLAPPDGTLRLDLRAPYELSGVPLVLQAALLHAPSPLEWRFSNVLTAQR